MEGESKGRERIEGKIFPFRRELRQGARRHFLPGPLRRILRLPALARPPPSPPPPPPSPFPPQPAHHWLTYATVISRRGPQTPTDTVPSSDAGFDAVEV